LYHMQFFVLEEVWNYIRFKHGITFASRMTKAKCLA
jgi:hypothetical protein